MPRRFAERGEGNLGCILWVAALGLAVLIAVKMVPVKIASSQLYDQMEDLAKHAAEAPPDAIAKAILNKAKELELPVTKEDVHVERVGDSIRMRATFTVPVDFPGYTYLWHFDHQVNRPIYIF
ncbi:MAG: hypothetical protein JOZ15_01635 [Acidobacteria bacterium]|nr:hypothetical protein [Acidobacteriota bacterium]